MQQPPDLEQRLEALSPQKRLLLERLRLKRQAQSNQIIPKVAKHENYPLSFAQERLWFLAQLEPDSAFYNCPIAVELEGEPDLAALEASLNRIVARHELLRTRFETKEDRPVQIPEPHQARPLPVIDLRRLGTETRAALRLDITRGEAEQVFDPGRGFLFRRLLIREGKSRHVLLLTMHHLVADEWSMGVLLEDLKVFYRRQLRVQADEPPPLAIQYGDFAAWQRQMLRGRKLAELLAFWRDHLAGTQRLELNPNRPRPKLMTYAGNAFPFKPAPVLVDRIQDYCGQTAITPFMFYLTAFQLLLHRYTGQTDFVSGTLIAHRNRQELENLIGFFVNILVMRMELDGDPSGDALLALTRDRALEAFAHQDLPFDKLVEALHPQRDPGRNPLIQVMFVFQNTPMGALALPGLRLTPLQLPTRAAHFDIILTLSNGAEGFHASFQYNTDLFDRHYMGRMAGHYLTLLGDLVHETDQRVSRLELLTTAERHQQLIQWNDTAEAFPRDLGLHQLFRDQVERTPETIALIWEKAEHPTRMRSAFLSLSALDHWSDQVAEDLIEAGVQSGEPVGIFFRRSATMVAAMLGVLKTGAAYVPLDPDFPADRLDFMIEDAGLRLLLGEADRLGSGQNRPRVQRCPPFSAHSEVKPHCRPTAPGQAAYFIYTSGSTGKPKGVVGLHHGAVNRIYWMWNRFPFHPRDLCCQKTALNFVDSVWEVFGPLLAGIPALLLTADTIRDTTLLARALIRFGVTRLSLTPSHLSALLETTTDVAPLSRKLRFWTVSGEALSRELLLRFRQIIPAATLVNLYGSSEVSADVTYQVYPASGSEAPVLIGRPIANTRAYVLDEADRLLPMGQVGRLHIAGSGVAEGYHRRPELTDRAFKSLKIRSAIGAHELEERLYRTGDLARYRPDGSLEFMGRRDHQLQIRGYRVELGEIEAALKRHPRVSEAVVTAADHGAFKSLTAHLVRSGGERLDPTRLAAFLSKGLPEYMIPNNFIDHDQFPLNPHGKLDRAALAHRVPTAPAKTSASPRTPHEEILVALWQELLQLKRVGIHDNFFELGGHSLLGTRFMFRLRKALNVEIQLSTLFESPTIAALAQQIDQRVGRDRSPPPLPAVVPDPLNRHQPFPLTPVQQAYLVGRDSGLELGNIAAHSYMEFRLPQLNTARLNHAFCRLIQRHDMLRAIMTTDGLQRILSEVPDFCIALIDLSRLGPAGGEYQRQGIRRFMSHRVFSGRQWPLFDLRISRISEEGALIHFGFDLLLGDARSFQIMLSELEALYLNPAIELAPLTLSFRDYVLASRELHRWEGYERSRSYWQQRLAQLPPAPELPLARDPARLEKPEFLRRHHLLEQNRWLTLKNKAARAGLTPSGLLLAAFAEVLAFWSKSPRFTLNLTLFNRLPLHGQVDDVIGDFTALTLLEVDHSGKLCFTDRARKLQERLWQDLDHRYYDGVQVMRDLARSRGTHRRAIMPVVFTSALEAGQNPGRHKTPTTSNQDGQTAEAGYRISQTPQVWLDHQVFEVESGLLINWDAVEDLFPALVLDHMFAAFTGLLDRLAQDDTLWRTNSISLLPQDQAERRRLVNQTERPLPTLLLHQFFADQTRKTPHRIAILSGDRHLDYATLDGCSEGTAQRLRKLGARPNSLIPVTIKKGRRQVIAVLAILKAGAAYLPLDPDLPPARMMALLNSSRAEIVLSGPELRRPLETPRPLQWLTLEPELQFSGEPLPSLQNHDDLAYVIFTSGSTGKPKGVMIDHRGAANTIHDINHRFGIDADDRVLALSALSFDLSVYDLFGILARGGAVVVPQNERDPSHWLTSILRNRITLWNSVPALLNLLVAYVNDSGKSWPASLRLIFLSGDWIPVNLPHQLHRFDKDLQLISMGGATEASIWSIYYRMDQVTPEMASIPYGKPLGNQTFHVLDNEFGERPDFTPGELYIGGVGLAKGYWRDEQKTAARFVRHPDSRQRLYCTGDWGRYLPEGNIEFLGREDFQVKVNGYRIELGEIETRLAGHPSVRTAVAAALGAAGQNRFLAAYFVAEDHQNPTSSLLKTFLEQHLPVYMIPTSFTRLESLPLTANGKIDRQALPDPRLAAVETAESEQAEPSPLEAMLCRLWAQLLERDRVNRLDNFFELGGNSLIAIRLIAKLGDSLGVRLPLVRFFECPTVAALAAELEKNRSRENDHEPMPGIVPDPGRLGEPFPLTDIQEAYWVGREGAVALGNVATHTYAELDFQGMDLDRFHRALISLIERHPMLRMTIRADGLQQILPQVPPYPMVCLDLAGLSQAEAQNQLEKQRERMSHQVFATHHWPLLEIRAFRLDSVHTRIHISVDLLIADAHSFRILQTEWSSFCRDPEAETRSTPAAPLLSFRDYVLATKKMERDRTYQTARRYWSDRLEQLPAAPKLPLTRFAHGLKKLRFSHLEAGIEAERWTRLKQRAASFGLTPSGFLCAAFSEILSFWSASPSFTLNLTTFNRLPLHEDVDRLVGDFTSTTLLAVDHSGSSFEERAQRLQKQIWRDLEHRQFSGIRVLRELRRRRGRALLMPVVFTSALIRGVEADSETGFPWPSRAVFSVSQTPQVFLDHQVSEQSSRLLLSWDFVAQAFPEGLIPTMFQAYIALLNHLSEDEELWHEPS